MYPLRDRGVRNHLFHDANTASRCRKNYNQLSWWLLCAWSHPLQHRSKLCKRQRYNFRNISGVNCRQHCHQRSHHRHLGWSHHGCAHSWNLDRNICFHLCRLCFKRCLITSDWRRSRYKCHFDHCLWSTHRCCNGKDCNHLFHDANIASRCRNHHNQLSFWLLCAWSHPLHHRSKHRKHQRSNWRNISGVNCRRRCHSQRSHHHHLGWSHHGCTHSWNLDRNICFHKSAPSICRSGIRNYRWPSH